MASADGAAYVDGRSEGLSSPGDKQVFGILRVLADVVLVGAGTARVEEYKPARRRPSLAPLREGRPAAAPIALVTRTLGLNLASPLFTEAPPDARTIVITCAASDDELRAETAKVADVIVAGEELVDLAAARAALEERGLPPRAVRGRPAPVRRPDRGRPGRRAVPVAQPSAGRPGAARIIDGTQLDAARPLVLTQVLAADDGFLFCRYTAEEQ